MIATDGGIGHNSAGRTRCIFRAHGERGYTKLKNTFLQDRRISDETRGLVARLLSLPDDWEITVQSIIASGKAGRDKVYRMIKEAEEYGYIQPDGQVRASGKFDRQIYFVSDDPEALIRRAAEEIQALQAARAPHEENTDAINLSHTENPDATEKQHAEMAENKEHEPYPENTDAINLSHEAKPYPENPQRTKEYEDKINNLSTREHARGDGVEVDCEAINFTLSGQTRSYAFSEIDLWAFNARMNDTQRARKIVEAKLRGWLADRKVPDRPADWLQRALRFDKIDDEVGDSKVARARGGSPPKKPSGRPRAWD